jgi:hypothetical protein
MFNISVEKSHRSPFTIDPMSIKRDWMDQTSEKHAYRCFPVTQANVIGWSISCSEDIVFYWVLLALVLGFMALLRFQARLWYCCFCVCF